MHQIKDQTDYRSEHRIYMAAIFDLHHTQTGNQTTAKPVEIEPNFTNVWKKNVKPNQNRALILSRDDQMEGK